MTSLRVLASRLRVLVSRVLALFRSSRMARDLDDEIRDHLERATADYVARGLSPGAARSAAQAQFGSALCVKDAHRDVRALPMVDSLARDIRYAVRGYRRTPLFAGVVIATLSLSIGATSAIFALVNAVVLRPLPYPQSDGLVQGSQARQVSGQTTSVSPPNFFDIKDRSRAFSGLAAYWNPAMKLSSDGSAPERVALVGDALWRRRFGSDPSIIGRKVFIDDTPVVVVGVMPEGVAFPAQTEVWAPIRLSRTQPPNRAIPPEKYRQYRILDGRPVGAGHDHHAGAGRRDRDLWRPRTRISGHESAHDGDRDRVA